ncbi:MAG: hypothetical protein LBR78_02775 [Holosporales bacterium]|jgi:hypothetical protein|nr:hypothetical protein [Holosporales bacterium]
MKKLLYLVVFSIFSANAMEMELPRGIRSARDVREFRGQYYEGRKLNSYDTSPLKAQFTKHVSEDESATGAMNLFLDCKYWHLVDYCEDNLSNMADANAQLFREILVLLAPRLDLGNYTARVVKIIGEPESVTADYFQNRELLRDMFFYSAVENAGHGRSWSTTETCISICDELSILARLFHWCGYEKFTGSRVRDVAYSGELTEDNWRALATRVWPNLPDAFTHHKWSQRSHQLPADAGSD